MDAKAMLNQVFRRHCYDSGAVLMTLAGGAVVSDIFFCGYGGTNDPNTPSGAPPSNRIIWDVGTPVMDLFFSTTVGNPGHVYSVQCSANATFAAAITLLSIAGGILAAAGSFAMPDLLRAASFADAGARLTSPLPYWRVKFTPGIDDTCRIVAAGGGPG